ncbi:MAG: hypothetical protein V1747_01935 [Candidatus Omnitrophota bacterium]
MSRLIGKIFRREKSGAYRSHCAAVLVILVCIFVYTLPLLLSLNKAPLMTHKNQVYNWYCACSYNLISYASILADRSLPFWVPFEEGGLNWNISMFNFSYSPFFLLVLGLGIVCGVNSGWYFAYFAGALSMFYLARFVLKYNIFGAVFCSLAFSMCGFFPVIQQCGLIYNRDILFLPLVVALFLKARHDNKYIFFTALTVAVFFITTVLFLPLLFLLLFLITLFGMVKRNGQAFMVHKRGFVVFFAVLVLTLLFSAYRILPILALLSADMNITGQRYEDIVVYGNSITLLLQRLFVPENFGVGSMYFGFLPVVLCFFSGIVLFRRMKHWLLLLVIFTVLSFGQNSWLDLHRILWYLPFFKSISSLAKYYGLIIVFLISVISGGFFMILEKKLSNKKFRIISILIIAYVFVDLLCANIAYFRNYRTDFKLPELQPFNSTVRIVNMHKGDEGGGAALKLILYCKGFGMTNFYPGMADFFGRAIAVTPRYFIMHRFAFMSPSTKIFIVANPAYKGEAFFIDSFNHVTGCSILPRKIIVHVDVKKPGIVVVNQNFDKNWKSNAGVVENFKGLLSLRIEQTGKQTVSFYLVPVLFYAGVVISAVSLIGCLNLLVWPWVVRKRRGNGTPACKAQKGR